MAAWADLAARSARANADEIAVQPDGDTTVPPQRMTVESLIAGLDEVVDITGGTLPAPSASEANKLFVDRAQKTVSFLSEELIAATAPVGSWTVWAVDTDLYLGARGADPSLDASASNNRKFYWNWSRHVFRQFTSEQIDTSTIWRWEDVHDPAAFLAARQNFDHTADGTEAVWVGHSASQADLLLQVPEDLADSSRAYGISDVHGTPTLAYLDGTAYTPGTHTGILYGFATLAIAGESGATLAALNSAIDNLRTEIVASAPDDLNTLNELAEAINSDADFHSSVSAAIDAKITNAALSVSNPSSESESTGASRKQVAQAISDNVGSGGGGGITNTQLTTAIGNLRTEIVGTAPTDLNTLDELAAAVNDDAAYHSTVSAAIDAKITNAALSVSNPSSESESAGASRKQVAQAISDNVGSGGGLSEVQVDARVRAIADDFAETGTAENIAAEHNLSLVPVLDEKTHDLTVENLRTWADAPSDAAVTYARTGTEPTTITAAQALSFGAASTTVSVENEDQDWLVWKIPDGIDDRNYRLRLDYPSNGGTYYIVAGGGFFAGDGDFRYRKSKHNFIADLVLTLEVDTVTESTHFRGKTDAAKMQLAATNLVERLTGTTTAQAALDVLDKWQVVDITGSALPAPAAIEKNKLFLHRGHKTASFLTEDLLAGTAPTGTWTAWNVDTDSYHGAHSGDPTLTGDTANDHKFYWNWNRHLFREFTSHDVSGTTVWEWQDVHDPGTFLAARQSFDHAADGTEAVWVGTASDDAHLLENVPSGIANASRAYGISNESGYLHLRYIDGANFTAGTDTQTLYGYSTLAVAGASGATVSALDTAIDGLRTEILANAPTDLNTLEELADAINDDADFHSSVTTAIDAKITNTALNVGSPTSESESAGASRRQVAQAVSNLNGGAPTSLNTLNELAAAINDDADYHTTVDNAIAAKITNATLDVSVPGSESTSVGASRKQVAQAISDNVGASAAAIFGNKVDLGQSETYATADTWVEVTFSQAVPDNGIVVVRKDSTGATSVAARAINNLALLLGKEFNDGSLWPVFASAPASHNETGVHGYDIGGSGLLRLARGADSTKIWVCLGDDGEFLFSFDLFPLESGTNVEVSQTYTAIGSISSVDDEVATSMSLSEDIDAKHDYQFTLHSGVGGTQLTPIVPGSLLLNDTLCPAQSSAPTTPTGGLDIKIGRPGSNTNLTSFAHGEFYLWRGGSNRLYLSYADSSTSSTAEITCYRIQKTASGVISPRVEPAVIPGQFLALNHGHASGRNSGLVIERGSADADKRYLAWSETNSRFEAYLHGSGGYADLRAGKYHGDGRTLQGVPRCMRLLHSGFLSTAQPWDYQSQSLVYPDDPANDLDVPGNSTSPPEGITWDNDAFELAQNERTRRSPRAVRKFVIGETYFSDMGAAYLPGFTLETTAAARGDVDPHAGEFKYFGGYNLDNAGNLIAFPAGENANTPEATLLPNTVFELSAGIWRILQRVGVEVRSTSEATSWVSGWIHEVRTGEDDRIVARSNTSEDGDRAFTEGAVAYRVYSAESVVDTGIIRLTDAKKFYGAFELGRVWFEQSNVVAGHYYLSADLQIWRYD